MEWDEKAENFERRHRRGNQYAYGDRHYYINSKVNNAVSIDLEMVST